MSTEPQIKHISKEKPPNYQKILEAFPNCENRAYFCFGDTIYNPYNLLVTPDLCEHEEVHSISQGNFPEKWWDRYINEPQFRLNEEVMAYSKQYNFLKKKLRAKELKVMLQRMATALSGDLYRLYIPTHRAESLIRNYKEIVV